MNDMSTPMDPHINLNRIGSMMFDLDGTLIDSVPIYFDLMKTALHAVGLPPAPRAVVAEFMTGNLQVLEKMIPEEMNDRKHELVQEFLAVGRKLARRLFDDKVTLIKGVRELFSLLVDRNILIGVVTSTQRRVIDRKLAPLVRNGIRDALDAVIVIEDAPKRKPAPDPLIECARRMQVPTAQCVYVGDSYVDIRAGNAAGMITIGVLTGLDDYETLRRENPYLILDSVNDIQGLFQS